MLDDSLLALVHHAREERNLEYKGPLAWNDAETKAKICRSIMGMANLRDGGHVIIGVEENPKGTFMPTGMTSDQAAGFTQDYVAAFVAEYAAPFVEMTVSRLEDGGGHFVVIEVREFAELPVVCRKDGPAGLRKGAMFTRTRRMHETAEASSEAEMREILDLAIDKGIRTFISRAERAGLETGAGSNEKFEEELGNL